MEKMISVVVCTMNEEDVLEPCLKLLREQEVPCEIVVVDAHSKDNTLKIAKKYADKVVFDNGRGLSDARNVGWKNSSLDIVAYCDSDSLPRIDWTKNIIKLIEGNYCVSGPIIPYDGTLMTKIGFYMWANLDPRLLAKIGWNNVWGANMAFRKKILEKFPFRCKFLEDYDMGIQLRHTGKVKFHKDMALPVSARRFDKGFHRTCIKFYLREWVKRKIFRKSTTGYF